jgi:hypothetical protein
MIAISAHHHVLCISAHHHCSPTLMRDALPGDDLASGLVQSMARAMRILLPSKCNKCVCFTPVAPGAAPPFTSSLICHLMQVGRLSAHCGPGRAVVQ